MNLIIGGSGTLGRYLKKAHDALNIRYLSPSSKELDITSIESCQSFMQNNSNISRIYFLAAMTDVDNCQKNPKDAYNVNVQGVDNFINSISSEIRFIYISTSAVFGGTQKACYSELDCVNALNVYGMSKLSAENIISHKLRNYLIIRSSWLIGGGPELDKKFISKILPLLRNNENLLAVKDKYGSLTYAKHLAEFLVSDKLELYSRILHFSSQNYTSRYEIANYLAELLKSKSKIIGVDSSYFPLPAPRPISEALSTVTNLDYEVCWKKIIEDYLREWI